MESKLHTLQPVFERLQHADGLRRHFHADAVARQHRDVEAANALNRRSHVIDLNGRAYCQNNVGGAMSNSVFFFLNFGELWLA